MAYPQEKMEGGLEVSGASGCFVLPFPNRTLIDKIFVTQTRGVATDFTVDVYSRSPACTGDESLSDEEGNELPDELFKVVPTLSSAVVGGVHTVEKLYSPWVAYVNHDPVVPEHGPGLQAYKIYLKITPALPGNYAFAAAIRSSSDLQR